MINEISQKNSADDLNSREEWFDIAEYFVDSSTGNCHITQTILERIKKEKNQPWNVLNGIDELIRDMVIAHPQLRGTMVDAEETHYIIEGDVHFKNRQSIYIGKGSVIEHGSMIIGPCIIGELCHLRKGSYIRGNVIIGNECLIGNSCEIKNSVLFSQCQIAHFNYIGDSILGAFSHFSAGSITSNYKLDGSHIQICLPENRINTGLNKFGAIVGEHAEIGCNAVINPGSLIGRNSVIYPLVNFRGCLPSNRICKIVQAQTVVEKK